MALDLYTWIAQRLHWVPRRHPQFIAWAALKEQGPDTLRCKRREARAGREAEGYREVRMLGILYASGGCGSAVFHRPANETALPLCRLVYWSWNPLRWASYPQGGVV